MRIRIVILNFNGEKLLRECLPSVLEACRRAENPTKVVVLDNRSEDRSLEVLRDHFPDVEIYASAENRVLCSYNEYLEQVEEPVVILLNNDIRVAPDFVDPLVGPFSGDPELFMATPQCLSFDGLRYEGGRSRSRMKFGLFWNACIYSGYADKIHEPGFTMAAGYGAFDRMKFLMLGGYDDLYLPGRLEDTDLCFRAWRRGWKCRYEPRSVVYHKGGVAFHERFGARNTLILGHRNSFLFLWKNISDPGFLLEHTFLLLPRLFYAALTGKWEMILGFMKALPLLPNAIRRRLDSNRRPRALSDREIFQRVS